MDADDAYKKQLETLELELASLFEVFGGLIELIQQIEIYPNIYQKFGSFLGWIYKTFYHELYHGIYRLIDETKGVLSITRLLRDVKAQELVKAVLEDICNNKISKKVKKFREDKLGHTNKELILNSAKLNKFREETTLELYDMEELLYSSASALEKLSAQIRVPIYIFTPTPIRVQIADLFERLNSL